MGTPFQNTLFNIGYNQYFRHNIHSPVYLDGSGVKVDS
jgi:hypothetical protein